MRGRKVALIAIVVLSMLVLGCWDDREMRTEPADGEIHVGQPVSLFAFESESGCTSRKAPVPGVAWRVNGEPIEGSSFVPSKPGPYEITGEFSGKKVGTSITAKAAAEGSATSAGDIEPGGTMLLEDKPEPADPATLERVFYCGNGMAVYNGGKPVAFTLAEPRRVRVVGTYHYNLGKGTSQGGTITLKSADGKTVGEWGVTRTSEGQGGVPNAYWNADVDVELPAGSYTIHDSDPSSWSQNPESGGLGHAWVDAEKR